MKKCISILLILLVLATNGTAATDNNAPLRISINGIDIQKVDIQKVADIVKNVDSDKLKDIKPEDLPIITEDLMSGIGRADYVYHANFNSRNNVKLPASLVSSCYKTFGKWYNTPINYVINPSNSQGLSQNMIISRISASAETWDSATSRELFNNSYGIDGSASYGSYDGRNVIDIGTYGEPGVIAVTSIWYNIFTRQIYEFDIRLNDVFIWGDATIYSDPYLIDIQNIATHEFGHSFGLGDLYMSYCSQATMYGYSDYRETKKRSLESGDIKGVKKLYGS